MKRIKSRLLGKPFVLDAKRAHKTGAVTYKKNGHALVHFPIMPAAVDVPPSQQFDLTQATIFGLNERLTMSATSPIVSKDGSTLRDEFNHEWVKYENALEAATSGVLDYGTYVYYPEQRHLVRYCTEYWHRIVATASNSMLYMDPDGKLSWREVRTSFENMTIAVAGGSVGNTIFHTLLMDLRPKNIKIADKSKYKMENVNRVRLSYADIVSSDEWRTSATDTLLRNKAVVSAEQAYRVDPYLNIFVYENGLSHENVGDFFEGRGKEPRTDIIIEEVDDPRTKILLREEARRRRVPLLMVSDLGSNVQLDIMRYDMYPDEPLSHGATDTELLSAMEAVYERPGDRATFFSFVDCLLGDKYRSDELAKIIKAECEIPTSTIIPQLGSTTAVAAGVIAEAVARIRLGYIYPKQVMFNKHTFAVRYLQR
jgi:hypothetical protein